MKVWAKSLLVLIGAQFVACAATQLAKPTAYGAELQACVVEAKTWADSVPCCVSVAEKYGRDPTFCFEEPK